MSKGTLYLSDHPTHPYFMRTRFRYDATLKDFVKGFPGCQWVEPFWLVPRELLGAVTKEFKDHGWEIKDTCSAQAVPLLGTINEIAHPYQLSAVVSAGLACWNGDGGFLFNDPMGMGKTFECVETLRLLGKERVLVVAPAIVRKTWVKELDKWWPDHPPVHIVTTRKQAAEEVGFEKAGIHIISYALLQYLSVMGGGPDAVVYDEIHRLQRDTTNRYRAGRRLGFAHPQAIRLGLTGTVFTNKVSSAWGPLNILFPPLRVDDKDKGRYGTEWQFKRRYMQGENNDYGWDFWGVREDRVEELANRLTSVSARASEPWKYLPHFMVQTVYLKDRVRDAAGWAADTYESGAAFTCVLTHRRQLAHDIAAKLRRSSTSRGLPVRVITGEQSVSAREQVLDEVRDFGSGWICATVDSVGEGIDLTWFDAAGIAEVPPRVVSLGQVLGRFHRLTGTVAITVMGMESGDPQADMLANRIKALAKVQEMGVFEAAMSEFTQELRNQGKSEEELAELMRAAAADFEMGGWE